MIESSTFEQIRKLVDEQEVLISSHGYDELAEDGIMVEEIISTVKDALVIEDYPNFGKGHVLWCYSMICNTDRSMLYGGCPKGHKDQRC